jgi:putative SOS response-associated peptidase YedK
MCGRYALTSPPDVIAERFGLAWAPDIPPHYNIAPSQMIPVVRNAEEGRELAMLKWGLIPSWARDASIGTRLINARGETLGDKPAFRDAYRQRHCLVPADAFYEWKPISGRKQPYCIRMRDQTVFGTIVTVDANALVGELHDRMPLILAPGDYDAWLSTGTKEVALPRAVAVEDMLYYPVSPMVSNARNDVPACLIPIAVP